jgi:hypothetical protein
MEDTRSNYRESIVKRYTENPPFMLGRSSDEENVKQDLKDFYDLVTECLRLGDLTLLFDFAINPIFGPSGNINRLANPKHLAGYEVSIACLAEKCTTDFEKLCMRSLSECFKTASQAQ